MKIFKLGEDVLRQKALPVEHINDDIRSLAAQMLTAMQENNGIGLAAPQVGMSLRLFVVDTGDGVQRVFINPQIIDNS